MENKSASADHEDKAFTFYKSGDYRSALAEFSLSLRSKESWTSYQGLGWTLFALHKYTASIQAFKRSISICHDFYSYCGLGWSLFKLKKYRLAINAFKTSIAIKQNASSFQGLGASLSNVYLYYAASEALYQAVALKGEWNSYQLLGWSTLKENKPLEAIKAFKQSDALHTHWYTLQGLGLAYYAEGDFPKAIESFKLSLQLHKNWKTYRGLGRALLGIEKYQEAITAFQNALQLHVDWDLYRVLGFSFFQLKRYSEAIGPFLKLISLKPCWEAFMGCGRSYTSLNSIDNAIEQFSRLIEFRVPWKDLRKLREDLILNKQYRLLIDLYHVLAHKHPHNRLLRCEIGSMLIQLGKSEHFVQYYSCEMLDHDKKLIQFFDKMSNQTNLNFRDIKSLEFAMNYLKNSKYIENPQIAHLGYESTNRDQFWLESIKNAKPIQGMILEFGVFKGLSISFLAKNLPDRHLHGFDSFEGLPEDFSPTRLKGHTTAMGILPKVPSNVTLHKGWFEDTLPEFLDAYRSETCSLINIDCVLYSSTKTVLSLLTPFIKPGTLIMFDEYFNYDGWEQHEYKAFQEFVAGNRVSYEYVAYTDLQVLVRILEIADYSR